MLDLASLLGVAPCDPLREAHERKLVRVAKWAAAKRGPVSLCGEPGEFGTVDRLHAEALTQLASQGDHAVGYKMHRTAYIDQLMQLQATTIVYIVRDIRDVVLSAQRQGDQRAGPRVRRWLDSVQRAQMCLASGKFLFLRFEDLVLAPKATMDWLSARLGVRLSSEVRLEKSPESVWVSNSSWGDIQRPFDPKAVGRWQHFANDRLVRYSTWQAGHVLEALGYDVSGSSLDGKPVRTYFHSLSCQARVRERIRTKKRAVRELVARSTGASVPKGLLGIGTKAERAEDSWFAGVTGYDRRAARTRKSRSTLWCTTNETEGMP
jgi:hypothetical protein